MVKNLPDTSLAFELDDGSLIPIKLKSLGNSRSIRVWIDASGALVLTKPRYVSKKEALAFADNNSEWINKNSSGIKKSVFLSQWLSENPIYDKNGVLKVWLKNSSSSNFFVYDSNNSELVFSFNSESDLRKVFADYAKERLDILMTEFCQSCEIPKQKISIRNQSSLWGSRSSSGVISLNWRVMLLPYPLQCYVIAHELSHVKFMDHSVSFWIYLNRICEGAKKLDSQLSKLGKDLFYVGKSL